MSVYDSATDNALRPTTSNATSLPGSHPRNQASQNSLRNGAVTNATSNRSTRPLRDPFAAASGRRAPSRNHRRVGDEVLADSDSDHGPPTRTTPPAAAAAPPLNTRLRRVRRLSPESRQSSKLKQKQQEEVADMVVRQADGSFIRDVPGMAEALGSHLNSHEFEDESAMKINDEEYAQIARKYFTSGVSMDRTPARNPDEDYDSFAVHAMAHLRGQVLQNLEDERWKFEETTS